MAFSVPLKSKLGRGIDFDVSRSFVLDGPNVSRPGAFGVSISDGCNGCCGVAMKRGMASVVVAVAFMVSVCDLERARAEAYQ